LDTTIRELREGDVEAYVSLRREALLDSPLAFAASPGDDHASSREAVLELLRRAPDRVLLGAFRDGLVGVAGLIRDRHRKSAHKVHLWGMYVAPRHRGRGIAGALVEAAVRHARALPGVSWVQLSVSSTAPAARRLYERAGFRTWGTEPDALRHDGRQAILYHMALPLD
jgi:ribosomal protein S18 acetylase RimI-like enzyme